MILVGSPELIQILKLTFTCIDVSGVAWNADDTYLASVSLDSTVLIWSGQSFGTRRLLFFSQNAGIANTSSGRSR